MAVMGGLVCRKLWPPSMPQLPLLLWPRLMLILAVTSG